MSPSDPLSPPKYSSYVLSGKPVPFSSQRKKRVKQSIPATQTCYISFRCILSGIISSQILLMMYLVKSETTKSGKVDPQQHIAHAFSQVTVSLFYFGDEISRPRPKKSLKLISQGSLSQFSVFKPSLILSSEVCCPLAITYLPRSTQVTCFPANQCQFPLSAKININIVHFSSQTCYILRR